MTAISMNPEKMNSSTIAIYDLMCDGQWYDNQTLIGAGAALCATEERAEALKTGRRVRRKALAAGKQITEDDLVESGAKDMVRNRLMIAVRGGRLERTKSHHRMTQPTCAAWLTLRPGHSGLAAVPTPTDITPAAPAAEVPAPAPSGGTRRASHLRVVGAPAAIPSAIPSATETDAEATDEATSRTKRPAPDLIFGGIPEAEGWLAAPLALKSRVHFRTENDEVPLAAFRAALPHGCEVAFDEGTGLYRVDCEHGTGIAVRDFIRDWCEQRGLKAKSLRAEHNVRRRHLGDLDPQFLSDLCVHYAKYAQGRVKKHASTLQFHFADRDDQAQQVFEWILDAVGRYDDASGVPFGAFLSGRIGKWVHDLNREKYGRIISDTELKLQRAVADFTTTQGRKPTDAELAQVLGQDLATLRKNTQIVSTLQGLRNIGTLDLAPGEGEVSLPDEDLCDDRHNNEVQQSLLSQILTTSCGVDETARGKLATKPNVLGWVGWYEMLYGQKNKTELSAALSTSMRNMNEYTARVQARMETMQDVLVGG